MAEPPLYAAAKQGDVGACQELLKTGADVNEENHGWTALHTAVEQGHEECASILLQGGATVDAATVLGFTPLYWAAKKGSAACVSLLLKAGADVTAADSTGGTPLHTAAERGREACVSLLLKAGADVHAADSSGRTPLHTAAAMGREACVAMLLKAGANPNATTASGQTALINAAERGREACWSIVLARTGAGMLTGEPPLQEAVQDSCKACVSMLLEAGADADAFDKRGRTPLHIAIKCRDTSVVAMLAAAVARLFVAPHLLRANRFDRARLYQALWNRVGAAVQREAPRDVIIGVLQGESRWRRRRPLALIREQRRAVRDAGLVHKMWEREQEEAAAAAAAVAAVSAAMPGVDGGE